MTNPNPTSLEKHKRSKRVTYIDAGSLERPQKITGASKGFAAALVAAAVLLGGSAVYATADNVVLSSKRAAENMQQVLDQNLELNLPSLKSLAGKSAQKARTTLEGNGAVLVDVPAAKQTEDQMDVYAVGPEGSAERTAELLSTGMSKLPCNDFVELTYGTWRADVDNSSGSTVRVRYADYEAGSIEAAMTRAMESQGISAKSVAESGEDNVGNTYKTGTVRVGKKKYTWRVSVLPLSQMYDVKGLPEDACYVGIRYTRQ